MARRFANYDWAIKHSGGTVGGELQKYLDFKTGNTKLTKAATAAAGDRYEKGLTPFTMDIAVGALHYLTVVNRQVVRAEAIGLTVEELGLEETAATHIAYKLRPATIQGAKGTAAGDPETSQITGAKYKKRSTDAFSIPFGMKTAGDLMGTRFKALATIVADKKAGHTVSYTPERVLRD